MNDEDAPIVYAQLPGGGMVAVRAWNWVAPRTSARSTH